MPRSPTYRPEAVRHLESRLVMSQVFFSPVTGIIATTPPSPIHPGRPSVSKMSHTLTEARLADDPVTTTETSMIASGTAGTLTSQVIHEPNGSIKTVSKTATTDHGVETFTKSIILPDGTRQTETGTNRTVVSRPGSSLGPSRTTTFHHILTQPGLGVETINGTSVQTLSPHGTMTVTDQQVTHFDGSIAEVKLITTGHSTTSRTRQTTI